jgi:hypothetical protein
MQPWQLEQDAGEPDSAAEATPAAKPWTARVAELVVDALRKARIVRAADAADANRAVAIVEEEIRVRLEIGDRPGVGLAPRANQH